MHFYKLKHGHKYKLPWKRVKQDVFSASVMLVILHVTLSEKVINVQY